MWSKIMSARTHKNGGFGRSDREAKKVAHAAWVAKRVELDVQPAAQREIDSPAYANCIAGWQQLRAYGVHVGDASLVAMADYHPSRHTK